MRLILTIGLFVMSMSSITYADLTWQRITVDADVSSVRAIAIDGNNSLYAGLEKGLYKTVDSGKSWRLLGQSQISEINFLYIDEEDSNIIYAATKNGVFRSQNKGKRWQKIFLGKDVLEKDVLTVALSYESPKTIFIGTRSGIFFSPENRILWQKIGGKLSNANIFSIRGITNNSNILFVVSDKGVFRTKDKMSSYERVYTAFNLESEDSTGDLDSEEEEINSQNYFIRHIAFGNNNSIYLSTAKGLVVSTDAGRSWQKLIFSGLFEEDINYALVSSNTNVYLATKNGVFKCRDDICGELFRGADFKNCNQLAEDSQNNLYLGSDKGLFKMALVGGAIPEKARSRARNKNISNSEPTIQEIQKIAIKYAEVHPEKIANWRRQARLRAFLPEFDLSYDKTVFTSVSFPQGRSFVGPLDWGVVLKWDLADFVFSDDQTSIDVRSRLMVQLRDDILNEVTRLYFERRRLQLELEEEGLSEKAKADKLLRLEELTALIDGLTGGYLSKNSRTKEEGL